MKKLYTQSNVESLRINLQELNNVINAFSNGMVSSGRNLNVVQRTYNRYLIRTYNHLRGIVLLLQGYQESPMLILPISHIMRSLLVDFITSFYLVTFKGENDNDYQSFKNELRLLDRDLYKSTKDWLRDEKELNKYNPHLPSVSDEEQLERESNLRSAFSSILNSEGKVLSVKEIRQTSDRTFFNSDVEFKGPNGMMSEKYKVDHLKSYPHFHHLDAYVLYKYYTQFYHVSKASDHIMDNDSGDANMGYLIWAMVPVCHLCDTAFRVMLGADNKFSKMISSVKVSIENIVTDDAK